MTSETITLEISDDSIARLTLNRPDVCNALNDNMINEMTSALATLNTTMGLRVVVISGASNCFCAGLDVTWMEEMLSKRSDDVSRRLAHLLLTVKNLPVPTIAQIDGPCVGGGVALAACCDILVASEEAEFSLPAVHLGSAPSIVTPFIIHAIGAHQAKRYLLTGEPFSAERAKDLRLVHAVCMRAQITDTVQDFTSQLLKGAPKAVQNCKDLIRYCENRPLDKRLVEEAARRSVKSRHSEEARDGFAAFIGKRPASWVVED